MFSIYELANMLYLSCEYRYGLLDLKQSINQSINCHVNNNTHKMNF